MLGHLQEHVFTRLLTYRQAEIIWFILQLILLLLPGHFCLLGDGGEGPWHQPLPCQMLFLVDLLLLWLMQGLLGLPLGFEPQLFLLVCQGDLVPLRGTVYETVQHIPFPDNPLVFKRAAAS